MSPEQGATVYNHIRQTTPEHVLELGRAADAPVSSTAAEHADSAVSMASTRMIDHAGERLRFLSWRMSFSETRYPLFRDMR